MLLFFPHQKAKRTSSHNRDNLPLRFPLCSDKLRDVPKRLLLHHKRQQAF